MQRNRKKTKFETASVNLADASTAALRVMAIFSPLINLTVNFGIVIIALAIEKPK